jgi:hypothetical protein
VCFSQLMVWIKVTGLLDTACDFAPEPPTLARCCTASFRGRCGGLLGPVVCDDLYTLCYPDDAAISHRCEVHAQLRNPSAIADFA